VPNPTPTRTIRVSDEIWNAAKEKAAAEGVTVTDIVIIALEEFIES
jgi:predicted DNA binding CopG/RHH family protein